MQAELLLSLCDKLWRPTMLTNQLRGVRCNIACTTCWGLPVSIMDGIACGGADAVPTGDITSTDGSSDESSAWWK